MKLNTIEENKKRAIENIKNAKCFIAITNDNITASASKIEMMALVTTMLQELVEKETISKQDLDIIFEATKNNIEKNIENKDTDLDSILDKIAESIVNTLLKGEK